MLLISESLHYKPLPEDLTRVLAWGKWQYRCKGQPSVVYIDNWYMNFVFGYFKFRSYMSFK